LNKKQIARKFSKVLINTVEVSTVPKVIEELKVFARLTGDNKKLRVLFTGQIFSEEEKNSAMKALFSSLKVTPESEKFLRLIILKRHLSAIKEIIQSSIAAYNEKVKKMTALVISPVSMDSAHLERLKDTLKALTQRDIDMENQIDPSLLGGFIVKAGSTIFDSSLKGQLRLLKTELTR
jgi:ATP synthase F1 delta subunit